MAVALSKTETSCSSGSQRSLTGVASKPCPSRSTWPANRLPNRVIMSLFERPSYPRGVPELAMNGIVRGDVLVDVITQLDDHPVLRGEMALQADALVQNGFRVQEGLLGAPVAGQAEDFLADHDDEHQDQLRQTGHEQQKGERVRVKRD